MSVGINTLNQQTQQTQQTQLLKKGTPATPPSSAEASRTNPAISTAQKDKVSLTGEVKKDQRGIPLPQAQSVKVAPWGTGNNDNACLEGILRKGGYSQEEIYAKGPDGKSLLAKIATENGLKDPNLVHPGKLVSFVPKEELEIYEARQTTARRDGSLKNLARGPVKTPQGIVSPQEGFQAIADASLQRLNKAYQNLPQSGRKGVEEQLTVTASDWSKGTGNQARFERSSPEEKQNLQRIWLAQAASNYARSSEAQGKKSDLINLGQGARQYLEAQIGLQQQSPASPETGKVQVPSQQPVSVQGPKAPLPAFINAWGQGLRNAGQGVSNLGSRAQEGVDRGVDFVTGSIDGQLLKDKRWASQQSPTAAADIWTLEALGSSAHAVGGLLKGAARIGTGQLEASGAVIGGLGTAQQWMVNDQVYAQVNSNLSRFAQRLSQ